MTNRSATTTICFHDNTHGQNIQLSNNASKARRHTSFDNGITFTNRPIELNERVVMKIMDTDESGQWLGSLAVGFVQKDPKNIQNQDLSRSALPAICQRTIVSYVKRIFVKLTKNTIIAFYYKKEGAFYIVDGIEQEISKNIDVSKPLWGIIDLYGNVREATLTTFPVVPHNSREFFIQYGQKPDQLPLRYFTQLKLSELRSIDFYNIHGPELELYCLNQVVFRKNVLKLSRPYVFLQYPMTPGDEFYIRILCVDYNHRLSGSIGFTNAIPTVSFSTIETLPADDPTPLYSRSEQWFINPDAFDDNTKELDEYRFLVTKDGEVIMSSKNNPNQQEKTIAFVDTSRPLYPFFLLNGRIKALSVIGPVSSVVPTPLPGPNPTPDSGLCQICLDEPANLVIIPCGHMFFCSDCRVVYESKSQKRCPTCRKEYDDCFEVAEN